MAKQNPKFTRKVLTSYTIEGEYTNNGTIVTDDGEERDLLAKEEPIEEETGELSEYILSKYVCQLTNKQQLFVQSYIWFGKNEQGHVEDENGNILYIKQEVRNYRRAIAKKILKIEHILIDTQNQY